MWDFLLKWYTDHLGWITVQITNEDLLGNIFGKFVSGSRLGIHWHMVFRIARMRKKFRVLLLFLIPLAGHGQIDGVGPGRALLFDGVDDHVQFGDVYHNVNLPVSVSSWVFLDPSPTAAAPIFVSNDNTGFIYRGFWLVMSQSMVYFQIGDGLGGNNPAFRRGKQATIPNLSGRWIHVAAVARGPSDMDLYINGQNVGGNYIGGSSSPMALTFPGDMPQVARFFSNSTLYQFKGMIDEVRVWNRALTQLEIQSQMCKKLSGSETGLIGYWNFDETSGTVITDKSSNQFHGTIIGNPERVFSGAPIGDESTYVYPGTWSGTQLSMSAGSHDFTISQISGSPWGAHVYRVNSNPSQAIGLSIGSINSPPYFGVFLAADDLNNEFEYAHNFNGLPTCSYTRLNNSIPEWDVTTDPTFASNQLEILSSAAASFDVSLGPDLPICENGPIVLRLSDHLAEDFSFLWQDGSTDSTYTATLPGSYWVSVTNGCLVGKDTVELMAAPPSLIDISLGPDISICQGGSAVLRLKDHLGDSFNFLWQDGSTDSTYTVTSPGSYWVSVVNGCLQGMDSLEVTLIINELNNIPNVITPNGDTYNEHLIVPGKFLPELTIINRWDAEVYYSPRYQSDWNGGDLATGVYYYLLRGQCKEEFRGSVTIIR